MALTTGPSSDPATAPPDPDTRQAIPPAPRVTRRRTFLGSRRRQVLAGVIIAGAVAFLIFQGLGNATEYFKTADQAVADRAALGTRQFRIEGTVVNDVKRAGNQTSFSIFANNVTVPVLDTADPPQLFKPGIPVVLEGHWAAAGPVFDSDLIMVKHTASYTAAHPDRLQPQVPATSLPAGQP